METGADRTLKYLQMKKRKGEKIVALTAYDFVTARLEELAGIDIILVGDSVGMAVFGHENTLHVTMGMMLAHTSAVSRGAPATLVVGDMPIGSYENSDEQAVATAVRFISEAEAGAVKLEGGDERSASRVRAIVDSGIPVMGHIGLQPQSIRKTGGYRVVYSDKKETMASEALALQGAGVFAIVLESMEEDLARYITELLSIPTIGIGAGRGTDGQILVVNDILGLSGDFSPRFLKKYAALDTVMLEAFRTFITDVRDGGYPDKEHIYPAKDQR